MIDFPKPGGFASLTTTTPKLDHVPLGNVLRGLSDRLACINGNSFDESLETFLDEHERYADATRIASLSSPHALKAWAAERLPSIGVSYGFSNHVTDLEIQKHLDERGSLMLVEFADNLSLIATYCRSIKELRIEATPHSHGIEFRLNFTGNLVTEERGVIEEASIESMLNERASDNCLRKRIFATVGKVEAECIVLRKKVRLGFSPLF